jgi:hypothetical protein
MKLIKVTIVTGGQSWVVVAEHVQRVQPGLNGTGCILHFGSGESLAVRESIDKVLHAFGAGVVEAAHINVP